jgi:hypothetical protein
VASNFLGRNVLSDADLSLGLHPDAGLLKTPDIRRPLTIPCLRTTQMSIRSERTSSKAVSLFAPTSRKQHQRTESVFGALSGSLWLALAMMPRRLAKNESSKLLASIVVEI